jgi:type II secretory pathway pseudopilin PulG
MRNRAFTLVEVVVTLGIAVAMLLVLVQFFISTNKQFAFQKTFVEVAQGADDVALAVAELALPADQVLASRTFGATSYQSGTQALVLEIPSIDSSGAIISGTYDYAVFYITAGKLYRITEAAAGSARKSGTRLMSENVTALMFTYDDATFANVTTVSVSVTTAAGGTTHTVTQDIRLRNAPAS